MPHACPGGPQEPIGALTMTGSPWAGNTAASGFVKFHEVLLRTTTMVVPLATAIVVRLSASVRCTVVRAGTMRVVGELATLVVAVAPTVEPGPPTVLPGPATPVDDGAATVVVVDPVEAVVAVALVEVLDPHPGSIPSGSARATVRRRRRLITLPPTLPMLLERQIQDVSAWLHLP